jgi:DNA-directed RNA polymerase subunit M/transcription elongation factor TFIIS
MAEVLTCPGCQAVLRVRDDMAGKQIKCPRCAKAVQVPAGGGITKEARPRAKEPVLVEPIEDEEEEEAPVKQRSKYEPCPRCGAEEARRVKWTFWGSFYFTALFKHVRCRACGCGYNGRTGRSNLLPAILCVSVAAAALLGVLGFIAWFFHRQGYF